MEDAPPKLKLGLGGDVTVLFPPKAKGEAAVLAAGAGAAVFPPNEKGDAAAVGLAGS